jgi:hypothetical protein
MTTFCFGVYIVVHDRTFSLPWMNPAIYVEKDLSTKKSVCAAYLDSVKFGEHTYSDGLIYCSCGIYTCNKWDCVRRNEKERG